MTVKAFLATLRAGVIMLLRNRPLLLTSLGLSLISIFVFGWLFGGQGNLKLALGIADEDHSALSTQLVDQLTHSPSLIVTQGASAGEVQALRDGRRNAVIVIPAGFAANLTRGHSTLQAYYDQSNPATQASARMAVQSIVAGLSQTATATSAPVTIVEQAVSVRSLRQIDWLTPGMLGMLLMWANLSVGSLLVQWRKQGILRRLAATPLRPATLIGAQISARLALSLAQGAVLLAVAMTVFQVQVVGSWVALIATVGLGALTMLALGFIIGSFARSQEAAQAVVFAISFPMMFLGGSYFPTAGAPSFLTPVIKALPLSYLNDALRQIMNNGASFAGVQTDLLVLAGWTLAAFLVSLRAYRWG